MKKHWKYLQTFFCQYSPTMNFWKGCACWENAEGQLLLKCKLAMRNQLYIFFLLNTLYKGQIQKRDSTNSKLFHCNQLHAYISSKFLVNLPLLKPYSPKKWRTRSEIVEIALNISVINKNTFRYYCWYQIYIHSPLQNECMLSLHFF